MATDLQNPSRRRAAEKKESKKGWRQRERIMQSCPWSTHGRRLALARAPVLWPPIGARSTEEPRPAAPARSFSAPVCGGGGGDGDGDVRADRGGGDFSGPVCGHGSARGDPVDDGLPGRSAWPSLSRDFVPGRASTSASVVGTVTGAINVAGCSLWIARNNGQMGWDDTRKIRWMNSWLVYDYCLPVALQTAPNCTFSGCSFKILFGDVEFYFKEKMVILSLILHRMEKKLAMIADDRVFIGRKQDCNLQMTRL